MEAFPPGTFHSPTRRGLRLLSRTVEAAFFFLSRWVQQKDKDEYQVDHGSWVGADDCPGVGTREYLPAKKSPLKALTG